MRIRSIKPEFWRSDDIAALDRDDRLLFIGLWSYVDDNGVGSDRLSHIVADLFAADMEAEPVETLSRVRRGLAQLHKAGLIDRYGVGEYPYLVITGWERHQKIDRPSKPRYPRPESANRPEVRASAAPAPKLDEPSTSPRADVAPGTEEQGNRGTEEQVTTSPADAAVESAPAEVVTTEKLAAVTKATTRLQKLADETFDAWWQAWPKKVQKAAARKAWRTAVKIVEGRVDEIMAGTAAYIQPDILPDEIQFVPDPATFLNGQRWADDMDTLRAIKAGRRTPAAQQPRETAADRNRRITEARKRDEAARRLADQRGIDAGDQGSDDGSDQ